jgi:hypothetical protein
MNNTTINYSDLTQSIQATIKADNATANKWQSVGNDTRSFFGSETALTEVKAQFIADAILPALDKRHAQALAKDIPRKGSKDYEGLTESHKALWEQINQAKKDARSTCDTYFKRIVGYAFPKEKAESEPRTLKVKCNEEITKLIKAVEKAENCEFDAVAFLKLANNLLTVVNK